MKTIIRWTIYLVLMGVIAMVGMSMGSSAPMEESSPDMVEQMPAPEALPPMPSPVEGPGDELDDKPKVRGPRMADRSPTERADAALSSLREANIAFNTPEELEVGSAELVQLLLSFQESVDELKEAVTAVGGREGARVEVSNKMEARLTGSGFDIEPVTPETQVISPTGRTEWKWEVEPVDSGEHRLHLTLSAFVTVDGEKLPRVVKTFERTMLVKVAWGEELATFATDNWEWLWTTLLVPVGGEILRRRKKGKKKDAEES